jgi:hypothetical protein
MHLGGCLCGSIRYAIDGDLGPFGACHCKRCQRATGSAFAVVSMIEKRALRLTSGTETLAEYESSPGVFRVFCRACGSPLYSRRDALPDAVRVRVGTLDAPPATPPSNHIFVASKAPWYEIRDGAPQWQERPPQ